MGNRVSSSSPTGDAEDVTELSDGSLGEEKRLQRLWGNRRWMSCDELFSTLLTHPHIPHEAKERIYRQFCQGAPRMGYRELVKTAKFLADGSAHDRKVFFTGEKYTCYAGFRTNPSTSSSKLEKEHFSFHQILAGVTHLDEGEIALLEETFGQLIDSEQMRITPTTFEACLTGIVRPKRMIEGLFRAFDEDADGRIDFKEFVCGLSTLCRGPDGARLRFMARVWDSSSSGYLTREDLAEFCTQFQIEAGLDGLVMPISLIDFTCWLTEFHPLTSKLMLQLSQQIGLLALGLHPSSATEQLEMICDVKQGLRIEDLDSWYIVPWVWWSQLIVSLNPRTYTGEIPSIDNSSILAGDCMNAENPLFGCPILKPHLIFRKDYELIPKFLFNALAQWNRVAQNSPSASAKFYPLYPLERCSLQKEAFPPNGEAIALVNRDFPSGPCYIELYPPVVQLLRHSTATNEPSAGGCYSTWSYVVISRRTTIAEIRQTSCRRLNREFSDLRVWVVEIDGQKRKSLLGDDSTNLQQLGVEHRMQLLLELRNRDMSWPEELLQIDSTAGNGAHSPAYTGTGGVMNMGNTCYVSAAVQTLSGVHELTQYLLLDGHGGAAGSVSNEYLLLLKELCNGSSCAVPKRLKELVTKRTALFGDRLQHDCQEFLQILLDLLHNELAISSSNGASASGDATSADKQENGSIRAWHEHANKEGISIVSQLFNGQLRSQLKCSSCAHVSTTFDVFTCIQLPIPLDDNMLIYVNVLTNSLKGVQLAFRLPAVSTVVDLKRGTASKMGISEDRLCWLVWNEERSGLEADIQDFTSLGAIPWRHVAIYAYELEKSNTVHLVAVHRRLIPKPIYAVAGIDDFEAKTFGTPLLLPIDPTSSGRALYELMDAHIQQLIGNRETLPTGERSNRATDANEDSRSGHPFQLRLTLWPSGRWCARCQWTSFCRGCPIDPTDEAPMDGVLTPTSTLIAIDWKPAALYLRYGRCTSIEFIEDPSVAECERLNSLPLGLAECFADYVRPEIIGDSKCDGCNKTVEREKSLALWRLPKILVVHLKRFVYDERSGRHVKSTKTVDFPLNGFNPSPYMGQDGPTTLNGTKEPIYKCIAIVNHHGSINQGHYTSFVRREREQWFFFNDSHSQPISEETVGKREAYLLFYERIT